MPRPVRELWSSLGARPGDGDDLLVVGADVLSLDSVFDGPLEGEVVVRLFSAEAFGFVGPAELAALGVFWAPHLEDTKQLRAAVLDAQDRLRRKLDDESERLGQLGFRARKKAPDPVTRGHADVGGLSLDIVVGQGGELLLERVDGAEVPEAEREVMRELGDVTREQVQDRLAEHAHRLLEAGLVEAAAHEDAPAEDDDDGFDENPRTAQLVAPALDEGDPGTLLVPPPSEEGDVEASNADSEADLVAALDDEDLADSEEGPALKVAEDEPAAELDVDDHELTASVDPLVEETARGDAEDEVADEADEADEAAAASVEGEAALSGEGDDEDGFVRPVTAPALPRQTEAPASFAEYPALPTQQISMVLPDEGEGEVGLSALASGFDDDTGEGQALLSLSGDDGVMPSPLEATQLRPAPSSAELELDDEDDLATPPQGRPPVDEAAPEGDDDDEDTLARAPAFKTGRKGPSLVSSGSAGSSLDEKSAAGSASDDDDDEPTNAALPLADEEGEPEERAGLSAVDEPVDSLAEEPAEQQAEESAEAESAPVEPGLLEEDLDTPTALHGFEPPSSADGDAASREAMDRLEAEPTDPSLGVVARADDEAPLDLPSSVEVDLDEDEDEDDDAPAEAAREAEPDVPASGEDVEDAQEVASDDAAPAEQASVEAAAPDEAASSEEAPADVSDAFGQDTGELPKSARELATATALASIAGDLDEPEEPTEAGVPFGGMSGERLDALAAIVGEGMSSGKTGAIVLDADAFAYLRAAGGEEPSTLAEDPDALEREAEVLELKARELRAKAELLRERATVPVARRKLASALEKARAARAEQGRALLSGEGTPSGESAPSAESVPSDEGAFASGESAAQGNGFDDAHADAHDDALEDDASGMDAFADGVALEEVRAMLAAEEGGGDGYAATQLAEMDLGELRQPSLSGGVFEGGVDDDAPAYALDDHTGRGRAYRTSMGSIPQAASADVHALESALEGASEPSLVEEPPARAPAPPKKPAAKAPAKPPVERALALVVSDPRARERLKKHLEETFPRVVELASPREAASLSAKDVQAVVIVRPIHDDATVSGLEALEGSRTRPPVLVLSSDASFDGLPGVDLRLALGRRASEVARQVLEGLSTLGVRASA